MANQYGTKAWAKWANQNLGFALALLKEPDKKWDAANTHLEAATKSLSIIKTELEEIINSHKPNSPDPARQEIRGEK